MSSRTRPIAAPQCTQCLRNYAFGIFLDTKPAFGSLIQSRGKTKKIVRAKGPEETVKLLKNLKGIGKRGDFVQVMAGTMRNVWAPNRIAEHVTAAQLRAWRASIALPGADMIEAPSAPIDAFTKPAKVQIQQLSPVRTRELLQRLVPASIDFYRLPIPAKAPIGNSTPGEGGLDPANDNNKAIYGSVTTQNAVEAISAILAKDEAGAAVVITQDDIVFSEDARRGVKRGNRVGSLGSFQIEIKAAGDEVVIYRTVHVRDQNMTVSDSQVEDMLQHL